ncbi:MAG: hypothetical protein WC804_21895 [Sphingomonas sp.]|jgi:hypothetical protein
MTALERISARLKAMADRPVKARRPTGRLGEIIVETWLRETCRLEV